MRRGVFCLKTPEIRKRPISLRKGQVIFSCHGGYSYELRVVPDKKT